jgi:hypothetical protein
MIDLDNNHEKNTPPSSDGGIISSRPWVMDYVDINGLGNRIGLPKDRFIEFIVKETVDNALDFMEKEAPRLIKKYGAFTPELKVIVTKESNYLRISILNSDCETSGFTEAFIRSIFNFHESTGSKRNQFKVTKGWLGDALKAICGIPYALTHEIGNDDWNEPLIITSRNKQFRIRLIVDRAKKKLDATVEIVELSDQASNSTEFEIRYPIVEREEEIITKISNLLLRFALINLYIAFSIKLPGMDILDIPAVQTISEKWSNQISIWCYSEKDFEDLIMNLQNEDMMAYSILKEFREGTNISKEEASITIGELKYNKPEIKRLYSILRNRPYVPKRKKLDLPFQIKKKARMEAFKKRIGQLGYDIIDIKYDVVEEYFISENKQIEYPFVFESAVIHTSNLKSNLLYIEGINSSIPYGHPFVNREEPFTWQKKGSWQSEHLTALLAGYGYSIYENRCSKPRSIIITNLISPRTVYQDYGKSKIEMVPSETISKLIKKVIIEPKNKRLVKYYETILLQERWDAVKTRKGWKKGDRSILDDDPLTQSGIWYDLREKYLIPNHIPITSTTRSQVTGNIRKICKSLEGSPMREDLGIIAGARASLYFDGKWENVDMDEIVALAEKGTDLVFIEKRGVIEIVSKYIGRYGIAFCNTQGHFTEYAKDLARASKEAKGNVAIITDWDCAGVNIAERVRVKKGEEEDEEENGAEEDETEEQQENEEEEDEHDSAIIERLGITFDTLKSFQSYDIEINQDKVEETYPVNPKKPRFTVDGRPASGKPGKSVTAPIRRMAESYRHNSVKYARYEYISDNEDYLCGVEDDNGNEVQPAKRIEIDSVLKKVGGRAFAKWIISELEERFPNRDYNRAIKKMTDYTSEKFKVLPDSMKRVIRHIFNLADAAAESEEKKIESEQQATEGFIDIVNKKKENVKRLADVVAKDYDIQIVNSKMEDLLKILESYDYGYTDNLETFKAEAERYNVPLKDLMQYAFIIKNGNKKQKDDADNSEKSGIKLEDIYKEVMSGVLAKLAGGGGSENNNKDT